MDLSSFQSVTLSQLITAITAIGALGTAAFGLVDASKIVPFLVPRAGFGYIRDLVTRYTPPDPAIPAASALTPQSIIDSLRSNWLNGMASGDQKMVAKTLIKLRMNPTTSPMLATLIGVDPNVLTSVAQKLTTGEPLTQPEMDTYGRFDVLLTTEIDRAFQRADQLYRTTAKVTACIVAVLLAEIAAAALSPSWPNKYSVGAFLVGLVATPLAPIAKDLTTALTSAATAVQSVKR